ncbi:vacuolar sorting-associated protein-like protein [Dothidotthia symphoricarpi CBS 119687]|uniref:Vacuolar sorting-associated protein-like protein n=1 Tax=Dothidotthia symphoricarpi CBS 119687 TaxID=1392245 RepID=A0A6A6AS63_9PLEO|nr:vacuolar sorting-associated protein-like protein [Dothidotthia symphoricarpi CBS 119687]KAF2134832.1 vacuolar sorting-associated protein-like protein [Dothidotthia symphoricarpi CBS 119687]
MILVSIPAIGLSANSSVPLIPFFQNGGVQAPLLAFLPSSHTPPSLSSLDLPEYPTVATYSSQPARAPDVVLDASREHAIPTIAIPTAHTSNERPFNQEHTPSKNKEVLELLSETKSKSKTPAIVAAAGTLFSLRAFSDLYQKVNSERVTPPPDRPEELTWVTSSQSWVERKVCTWFGLCDVPRLDRAQWITKSKTHNSSAETEDAKIDLHDFWVSAQNPFDDLTGQEENDIPKYVLKHAPLVHLYSGEQYWPCDMQDHLIHTTPHLNYTALQAVDDHPNLSNLADLNRWGRFVYLQSDDNVEDYPEWLGGEVNIPNPPNRRDKDANWKRDGHREGQIEEEDEEILQTQRRRLMGKKVVGGKSDAPAVLIVVPKDDGVVDAFWFFFYSYNLGPTVFNVRFGNHVGDWEHTAVRFQNGVPKAVYYSEHAAGSAYTWDAVEKIGKRPVSYSAIGTHAMYATPGVHPYALPGGILHDVTDRGPLWDPVQNMYSFTYDYKSDHIVPSTLSPNVPVNWFYFGGHWGDKFYPLSDPRQYRFLGQYHYVNGPLGPRFKNLGRQTICIGSGECVIKRWLGEKRVPPVKEYPIIGEGEEMSEEDARRVFGVDYDFASWKGKDENVI